MKPLIPLRPLLWFDATTCIAMSALLAAAGGPLSPILGLPNVLLMEAGILLLLFALFVGWAATRTDPSGVARIVLAANIAWVIGSLALLAGPWLQPTLLGTAFVAVQALAVVGIGLLQWAATRPQMATA
jgi:hypothetical protein